MTIRIVTDSTSDISPEQAAAYGITVVPLSVFFDEETFLDNVDLDNEGFYQKLQASATLPRSSQPAPAKFQEAYLRLIEEGATGIISVHLSANLSGTYQSACTARDSLSEEQRTIPIEVIDSKNISAAMSIGLFKAVEEAKQGLGIEEIKANLIDHYERTKLFAVLDTLEFVKRGGRIGGAKALLANMLSVKPIISLKDGTVIPVEQPRTRNKAFARIAQIVSESEPLETLAIGEAGEEVGKQLYDVLKESYAGEIKRYKLGAVIGTHTGPGTVAIVTVSAKK
ncbi:DegV family protein [Tengunoibacter tsumagoiensis]|uniref:DegV domain-containing protein n=1 Tax=Tengunoibacter tsumagoiensis TaxID=2014871 RepID=A0A402A5K5_9CHLR|nr:DegV family protein [Tengunoibacter tsumagoiensis]GCE14301.1 DegV domain-containing protein [Tengunoibacter tsumagoiensis]